MCREEFLPRHVCQQQQSSDSLKLTVFAGFAVAQERALVSMVLGARQATHPARLARNVDIDLFDKLVAVIGLVQQNAGMVPVVGLQQVAVELDMKSLFVLD